jgi:hypothetical protein
MQHVLDEIAKAPYFTQAENATLEGQITFDNQKKAPKYGAFNIMKKFPVDWEIYITFLLQ